MSQKNQIPNYIWKLPNLAALVCAFHTAPTGEGQGELPCYLGQVSSSLRSPTVHMQTAAIINDTCLDATDISVSNLSSSPKISFYREGKQAQKG